MEDNKSRYTLRIDQELLDKFGYVAEYEGRTKNGELVHMIADAHIYDRHVDIVRELITRPTHPAPRVTLNPEVTDFYDFTTDDLLVEGYETGPQVRDIPIAI